MAEPVAAPIASSRIVDVPNSSSVIASTSIVLGFWWAATGFTLAMQRSDTARTASLIATTALGALGVFLVVASRSEATVRGARRAFLGAAMIWWWSAAIFYSGWGIDLTRHVVAPPASLALAAQAIVATWRADMIGVAALIAIALGVRNHRNRAAAWTFATFWATLQTAKLNVFFGVRNSGVELLPAKLEGLAAFFGPPRNSLFLPLTVLVLAGASAILARRAWRATDLLGRHAFAMVAMLMGLAVLEHALLAVPADLPLWDVFLRPNP